MVEGGFRAGREQRSESSFGNATEDKRESEIESERECAAYRVSKRQRKELGPPSILSPSPPCFRNTFHLPSAADKPTPPTIPRPAHDPPSQNPQATALLDIQATLPIFSHLHIHFPGINVEVEVPSKKHLPHGIISPP